MKKKIIILLLILFPIITIIFSKNIYHILPKEVKYNIKTQFIKSYNSLSNNSKLLIRILGLEPFGQLQSRYKRNNPKIENLNNDYNVKFLPETQFGNFNLSLSKINFKSKSVIKNDSGYSFFKPFYLEIYDENILIINSNGEILFSPLSNLDNPKIENLNTKLIKSDLKVFKIMGTLIYKNIISFSYIYKFTLDLFS